MDGRDCGRACAVEEEAISCFGDSSIATSREERLRSEAVKSDQHHPVENASVSEDCLLTTGAPRTISIGVAGTLPDEPEILLLGVPDELSPLSTSCTLG